MILIKLEHSVRLRVNDARAMENRFLDERSEEAKDLVDVVFSQ